MSELFRKVAKLTISNRQLESPPMDLEFDQKINVRTPPVTEVKLYNPNEDTIETVSKINLGVGPTVKIDAGFENEHGVCVNGYVSSFHVKKEAVDKILTFQVTDAGNNLSATMNKTYINQQADVILKDLITKAGIEVDAITLGIPKLYEYFTAMDFGSALRNICEETLSAYYYENGVMTIIPEDFQPANISQGFNFIYLLSANTGLVNVPEKALVAGMAGIQFQTLFLYNLHAGSIVKIESKYKFANGRFAIQNGVKRFSSFGKSECEFKAIML